MDAWIYGSTEQKHNDLQIIPDDPHRKNEYEDIVKKHPNMIPILVHAVGVNVTKSKFLANRDARFEKFILSARSYCPQLKDGQVIFFSANEVILHKDAIISELYETHKRDDGFLHVTIRPEPDIYPASPELP